jgi:hypothetical protein
MDITFSAGAIFVDSNVSFYYYRIVPFVLVLIALVIFAVNFFLLNQVFNKFHNDFDIIRTRIFSQFGVIVIIALRIFLAIIGPIATNSLNQTFMAIAFFLNPAINIITGFIILGINIELIIKMNKLPLKSI